MTPGSSSSDCSESFTPARMLLVRVRLYVASVAAASTDSGLGLPVEVATASATMHVHSAVAGDRGDVATETSRFGGRRLGRGSQRMDVHGAIAALRREVFVEGVPRHTLDVVCVVREFLQNGACTAGHSSGRRAGEEVRTGR